MVSSPRGHKRRKTACKEFQCTHDGCGRTYSRAEHLQRHQLNHSPKEIYHCDYPECSFSFVRKDLYARHKLRHERQMQEYGNGRLTQRSNTAQASFAKRDGQPPAHYSLSEDESAWSDTQDDSREITLRTDRARRHQPSLAKERSRDVSANPSQTAPDKGGTSSRAELQRTKSRRSSNSPTKQPMDAMQFSMNPLQETEQPVAITSPVMFGNIDQPSGAAYATFPGTNPDPMLDEQAFGPSPSSTDEFTSWLFNGQGIVSGYPFVQGSSFGVGGYSNNFGQLCTEYSVQPGLMGGSFVDSLNIWPQPDTIGGPANAENVVDLGTARVSEYKRQSLLQYVMQRFNEIGSQGTKSAADIKSEIFGNDVDGEPHVLSLPNIERYIASYWENFHDQLPILHQPTFIPEKAHDFLLLAVLVIGASMLARKNGPSEEAAKLSKFTNFVSWNLRWQVFMHGDSHPPAKLWVIQTLLLLEVYEKMNATRMLHERAHIYFPTTLSLMRRGSALTGKQSSYNSRLGSPLNTPRRGQSPKLSSLEQQRGYSASPKGWWDHWIAQEATRRAAIAAFILDATHAALFGHTPTLVIHEIKLPLPCDNTLWSSESPSEIGCVESSLHANGVTPLSFLEGLQRTLNGQRVHTSPFGRIALLAALLSVTWQMHQRDLDRSTFGSEALPGVQERWRPKLLKALDWWKRDYEDGIAHVRHAAFDWQKLGLSNRGGSDDKEVFQTLGTVLYHLGHISVYVSMPDLCIFAGVTQILGRNISSVDSRRTGAKIREWAASPGALGAVYHALSLVKEILLGQDGPYDAGAFGQTINPVSKACPSYPRYNACWDNLLTRPWALYYATLVLWAYGYVQDSALDLFPEGLNYPPKDWTRLPQGLKPTNHEGISRTDGSAPEATGAHAVDASETALTDDCASVFRSRNEDLKIYMQIMIPPHVDSTRAFHHHQNQVEVTGNRNKVVGLLSIVDKALDGTPWELLSEARHRLQMAAALLRKPGEQSEQ